MQCARVMWVLALGCGAFLLWYFLKPDKWCETECTRTTSYPNFALPLSTTTFANLTATDNVIFIGLDGFGFQNMHDNSATMPFFQLLKNSSVWGDAIIDCSWASGPNWYGMISGLNSHDSGICDNDVQAGIPQHRTVWDVAHSRGKSVGVFTEWSVFATYGNPATRTNRVNPEATHNQKSAPWLTNVVVPAFGTFEFMTVIMDGFDANSHVGDEVGFRNISAHYDKYLFQPLWLYLEAHANVAVVVTADHGSSIDLSTHNHDPVPFMVRAPSLVAHREHGVLANNMVAGVVARLLNRS